MKLLKQLTNETILTKETALTKETVFNETRRCFSYFSFHLFIYLFIYLFPWVRWKLKEPILPGCTLPFLASVSRPQSRAFDLPAWPLNRMEFDIVIDMFT